jgi:hypothetical protein
MTRFTIHSLLQKNSTERALGLCVLLSCLLLSAWLAGGTVLLTRQLWMDEVHSWLLVTDPQPTHALQALRDGVDFNPPTWFMMTGWLSGFSDAPAELHLRLLSLFWMLLAVVGTYVFLTRRFSASVSAIASILVMCHPLLIHQSTEIRFYGFWCACIVWTCVAMIWSPKHRLTRWGQFLIVAALSAMVCTSHYFGILSLSLIWLATISSVLLQKTPIRSRATLLALTSMAAGAGSLLLCIPILIGQRSALTRSTWISPATLTDTAMFLQTMYPVWPVALCGLAALFSRAAKYAKTRNAPHSEDRPSLTQSVVDGSDESHMLPFAAMAAMPIVIALVAWCLQPALVTRYAIVGTFGMAPMFALLLERCSGRILSGIAMVSVATLMSTIHHCAAQWKADMEARDQLVQELRKCPEDAILISENRIAWMPVLHHYPEFSSRFFLADFETDQLTQDSSLRIVQRDVGRKIQTWYPQYEMRSIDSLASESQFYTVPYAGGTSHDLRYPLTHNADQTSSRIFHFTRVPAVLEARHEK